MFPFQGLKWTRIPKVRARSSWVICDLLSNLTITYDKLNAPRLHILIVGFLLFALRGSSIYKRADIYVLQWYCNSVFVVVVVFMENGLCFVKISNEWIENPYKRNPFILVWIQSSGGKLCLSGHEKTRCQRFLLKFAFHWYLVHNINSYKTSK